MRLEFFSESPEQTRKLARAFILKFKNLDQPLILALTGNLGVGKTCFIQTLAKALKIKDRVISPTFVVMKSFLIPEKRKKSRFAKAAPDKRFFWHVDCWRLEQPDFEYLGLKEIVKNNENIVCLEWAEKVKKLLPKNTVWLKFEHLGGNKRKITIE
ncbi:MAG: hypothetical protein UX26_C0001G0047 [Parcubacteria group bacterium GW2011_GWC1_45_9]|nr:MAG: hypothetical protein UW85_C0007G0005 [Parcubacteria group bacterium GW2011_GWA1_Parcubacteria_45_10]KKT88011.1 MAG: hypothetical protein UW89_C0013G0005 [Parcubacteria group bacterium GW2011_GWB1_45_10]KKU17477.1 MAG: hypothetical protein UX26_C0001G0047 [Parcubacteria group bacterium GW2011_GWC1_45_9]HCI05345.1 tRNA (adenosine(37)-N6)-threonylcarbamoyltransferase complex ATPase subunit type 1 TsaE [Patescibacteria group bacterium]